MRVTSVGGGPGGLYAAILLKKLDPASDVVVLERNAPDDTFGWGVVFSRSTLDELEDADPESYHELIGNSATWDPVEIRFRGETIRAGGNRFAAISRKKLLNILQGRARELGVDLRFGCEVTDLDAEREVDLLIGADGVNSLVRERWRSSFQPTERVEGGKYIWLGTTRPMDAFTFVFAENEHGPWQAHAYPFDASTSTFIVEVEPGAWKAAGLDQFDSAASQPGESDLDSIEYCEALFSEYLDGYALLGNNSKWLDWRTISNRHWSVDNVVLLGDAAHTAHFSIGSGTKLALEDAVSLANSIRQADGNISSALATYEADRKMATERIQAAAGDSLDWFGRYSRYLGFEPPQFAYSLLTRSSRVTYAGLKKRDPTFGTAFESWFLRRDDGSPRVVGRPPALTPLTLGTTTLRERLGLHIGMAELPCSDGAPTGEAIQSTLAKADGSTALALVEGVAVDHLARVTPLSPGLYTDEAANAWTSVVEAAHTAGQQLVGLQLTHAGPRGSARERARGVDRPLRRGAWPLVAASAVAYGPAAQLPAELDDRGLEQVTAQFVAATRRAVRCGFDLLEIQMGHGYLLSTFLSPLTNLRSDGLGGDFAGRAAFPLEILRAVRADWPRDRLLSVSMSASDLQPGGLSQRDAVALARSVVEAGADFVTVIAGQTTPRARPSFEGAYYSRWSDLIRNGAGVATATWGNVPSIDDANHIVAAGHADLVILGRPFPKEPPWLRREPAGPLARQRDPQED